MIAALELDGRLTRAGHAVAYLVVTLPVTLLALPAVAAADARRGAQRGRDRAAAAASPRRRACRGLERLDRRAANRWLDAQVPPIPGRVRGTRRRVPALARTCSRTARCGGPPRTSTLRPVLVAALLVVALAPVFALALLPAARDRRARGRERASTTSGRGRSGPALGLVLLALALPAAALALATLETLYRVLCVSTHALLTPRDGAGRAGARDAGREPRRPHGLGRLLAAGPRALRGRARPPGRAARAGLGPGVDRGRPRRPARRRDHPRRRARHQPGARRGRRRGRPRWRSTTSA